MSVSNVFQIAIDVAIQQRDAAQNSLSLVERNRLFAQGQMDQLTNYSSETEARWMASAQISANPELLRHHYQFMARLRNAIDLQTSALQSFEVQIHDAQQFLLHKQIRLRSLEVMLERKQSEVRSKQARREQIQMDEFAALQYSRKRMQSLHGGAL